MEPRPDDRHLIEQFLKGDQRSIQELDTRYRNRVYSQIYGMIWRRRASKEVAEDLTQDVMMKIINAMLSGKIVDYDKLTPYVWKVARRTVLDYFRKTQNKFYV